VGGLILLTKRGSHSNPLFPLTNRMHTGLRRSREDQKLNPNPNQKIKWHTQTWEREGARTSLQRQGARGRGRPWVHQREGAASGGGVAEEERSRRQGRRRAEQKPVAARLVEVSEQKERRGRERSGPGARGSFPLNLPCWIADLECHIAICGKNVSF
jgi:hypothetical protein